MAEEEVRKMTLGEWEKEKGIMIHVDVDGSNYLDENQFNILFKECGGLGVDYTSRTNFLKDNDYELTRTNYLSGELTVKPKENTNAESA